MFGDGGNTQVALCHSRALRLVGSRNHNKRDALARSKIIEFHHAIGVYRAIHPSDGLPGEFYRERRSAFGLFSEDSWACPRTRAPGAPPEKKCPRHKA